MKNWTSKFASGCATAAAIAWLAVSPGCDSAATDSDDDPGASIVIANQGNFTDGNGSVTRFNTETDQVTTLLSRPNSIIQSLLVRGGLIYVAMNTGNRIDVIDAGGDLVSQIIDVPGPRYLAWFDADHLLVSNLFENTITVIDPGADSVVDTIAVGPNPEGILVHGNLAYVSNHGLGAGSSISVVDVVAGAVTNTLQVDCDGPRFVFIDRQDEMWVVCTGQTIYDSEFNVIGMTDGAVLVVEPETGDPRVRFDVDGMVLTPGPGQDAFYSPEAEALFVVLQSQSILHFDTAGNTRIGILGPLAGSPIGAVAYDSQEQLLYVGRVPGFTSAGEVSIVDLEGEIVGTFSAGIAPSHIEIMREIVSGP